MSSSNSITFATTGTSDRLVFTLRGYYISMYSSSSIHPTTSSYDYYNTSSLSSSTFNRTISIDGCGSTPGRNELLAYSGSSSSAFVLRASDVTGATFGIYAHGRY